MNKEQVVNKLYQIAQWVEDHKREMNPPTIAEYKSNASYYILIENLSAKLEIIANHVNDFYTDDMR